MTKVKFREKPLWKESSYYYANRDRVLLVALEPQALVLRLKGTRTTLRMPYSAAYATAAMLEAQRLRAEKKSKKAK